MLERTDQGTAPLSEDAPPLRLDAYLPYRLSVTSNAVSSVIARAYADRFDLSIPEWRLIAVLGEGEAMTQTGIVARTAMDKMTVSRAAAALLSKALIERFEHGEDRRSHRLALTDAGWSTYHEIVPLALEYEAHVTAQLSPAELATLFHLLDRVASAADQG